jgi:hypothetical protein
MAKETVYKEGRWRCTHIDLSGEDACNFENRGQALKCDKCGKHRPKNVQFYLPDNAKVIVDQDEIYEAMAGANWSCMHCNYDNKATSDTCVHCDTIRDTEYEKWINLGGELKQKSYAAGQTPKSSKTLKQKADEYVPVKNRFKKYLKIGGFSLLGILVIWFIYSQFFATKEIEVEVAGYSWERQVSIEEEQTFREEGWSVPSGGRQKRKVKKQSGTEEVYDHSEWDEEPIYEDVLVGTRSVECGTIDNGNGTFETQYCEEDVYEQQETGTREVEHKVYRKEPVYDYWYTYDIDKWVEVRNPSVSGKDHNAKWPDYNLKRKERLGNEYETYTVFVKPLDADSKFGTLTYELPESEWNEMDIGEVFIAKVRKSGTVKALFKPE